MQPWWYRRVTSALTVLLLCFCCCCCCCLLLLLLLLHATRFLDRLAARDVTVRPARTRNKELPGVLMRACFHPICAAK
jgi:hypothetical protein